MVKKRGIWKWLITLVIIAGLAGGGYYYFVYRNKAANAVVADTVRTSSVLRGSISSLVSGSGSVATSREQSLAAPGASTLLEVHVEDGDKVSKGDVLFVLDCPEVVSSQQAVSKYEFQLAEYYAAKNELQRIADNDYLVTSLAAKVGDKLARNANLMSLLDISTMSIQAPASDAAAWEAGQSLQITLLEYGNTINGVLSGSPIFTRNNAMDYLTFTLVLDRGQRIGGETYGQAFNKTLATQAAILLKPNTESVIKSPADGYLEVLNAHEGEIIKTGTLMYRIDSTNLDSQISDANSEMQVAMSNLKQKKTTLTADFDGIYYAAADSSGPKNTFLQVGDSLRSAEGLGKIVDTERMQIVFNVDELDIAKVEIGQEVNVVADALPDKVYTGRVARIAQEGASSGNVAYYWVLIEVTDWDGLKVGMTSSLEIVVESSENTLMVPINAVRTMRGVKYVILAEDQTAGALAGAAVIMQGGPQRQGGQQRQGGMGTSASTGATGERAQTVSAPESRPAGEQTQAGNAPESRPAGEQTQTGGVPSIPLPERAVVVQTGIINDTFVEIRSGLEEGQVVELFGSASSTTNMGNMMFFGGGPGGGGPAGGGPVGGMTMVTRN